MRQALEQAKRADRTTLIANAVPIDVQLPGFESCWEVTVAEVTDQSSVEAARDAYEEKRKKQRVFV